MVSKWSKYLPPDSDSSDEDDPMQKAMRPSMPQRPFKAPKPRKRPAPPPEDTLPTPHQIKKPAPPPEPKVLPRCPSAEPDKSRFSLQTSATAVRHVQQPATGNKWGKFLADDNRAPEVAAAVKAVVEPPKPKVNKWSCFVPVEEKKAPVKAKSFLPDSYLSTETLNDEEFDALFTL